jgi:hypothetical protein
MGILDGALSWVRQVARDRSNTAFSASFREVPVLVYPIPVWECSHVFRGSPPRVQG